jgi:hypothetical protein
MSPIPLAAKPISGVSFVQLYVVIPGVLAVENTIAAVF